MDNNEQSNKQSFFRKLKTDKKYSAKVQLIGYTIFILGLIIFVNISNIGNNYSYNSGVSNKVNEGSVSKNSIDENKNLFKELDDNYSYNVDVLLKLNKGNDSVNEENVNYNGKIYNTNYIINKVYNNINSTYYKIEDEYYIKDNDEYKLAVDNEIYDLIDGKYIEFSSVKKYIDKASLEHFTNYSSGKNEYVYNLKVSEVIQSYNGDDIVVINVVDENNIISIDIDYTNLLKLIDDNIVECKINYKYDNINEIEKFSIIDEDVTADSNN